MQCQECGQSVEDGAVFCGRCGQHLNLPLYIGGSAAVLPSANTLSALLSSRGEALAATALVLAVLALPISVVPVAGFVLGMISLVIATAARRKYQHTLSLVAVIFAGLAISASLLMWGVNVQHDPRLPSQSAASATVSCQQAC
jgi:hypothetical protein